MLRNLGKTNTMYVFPKINKPVYAFIMVLLLPITCAWSQTQVPHDEQYKKRPTNAIAAIATGNSDEAIKNLSAYIADFPSDAESHYCLAVAYSVKGEVDKAMEHTRKALEQGMPLERFLAGPSNLLKRLTGSSDFKSYSEGKYLKLVHGPMLGDLTPNSVKVWVRTDTEATVTIEITKEAGSPGRKYSNTAAAINHFTAIVQITDLEPGNSYFYNVYVDGALMSESKSFTTPTMTGPIQVKVGFGGGAGYTPWFERMWDTLANQSFDAFLLLGDNVYIDYPEVPEAQQYCYYRRQSRPEFRQFSAEVPLYAIWDDHDFTVNDGEGGPEIDVPAWKRPVWELFKQQWPNPYFGGGYDHPGCWFDFSIGDAHFIMLDCRYYRENPKEVDDPSMLGEYQKAWLKETLQLSKATFKIIASSVPWARNTKPSSDDTWDGFPGEREEIFSYIVENKIEGVLLISADRHRSDAWKVPFENGYNTYDLMSSRLTNIHTHDLMEGSLFGYNKKCSFGTLEIDTSLADPSVTYLIKSIDNETIHRMTIYRSQLDFEKDKIRNKRGRP